MEHILALPVWGVVFWGVLTFSLLVFLHEGGHFLAARLFGVNVHEFMLGLPGPALRFRSKKSDTAFGVTAIPLGGYVRIAGMEPGPEDPLLGRALAAALHAGRIDANGLSAALDVPVERTSSLLVTLADYMAIDPADDDRVSYVARAERRDGESDEALLVRVRSRTYRGLATWKRIMVLVSGVLVNIVAATLTLLIVLWAWGYPTPTLVIQQVLPDTAAQSVGLREGDRVTAIDGVAVEKWDDLTSRLRKMKAGERVEVTYRRDGELRTGAGVLGKNERGGALLGVGPKVAYYGMRFPEAVRESLQITGAVFVALGQFLAGIVHPREFAASLKDARSVVGISEMAAEAAQAGPLDYAWLVAFLSLSLGAMNIIPIPPLDGGKVLMEGLERLVGRPLKREVSLAISAAGTLLLFTLVGYLMYADIARIAAGQ